MYDNFKKLLLFFKFYQFHKTFSEDHLTSFQRFSPQANDNTKEILSFFK